MHFKIDVSKIYLIRRDFLHTSITKKIFSQIKIILIKRRDSKNSHNTKRFKKILAM